MKKIEKRFDIPLDKLSENELNELKRELLSYPQDVAIINYYTARVNARLSALSSRHGEELFAISTNYLSLYNLCLLAKHNPYDKLEKINEIRKLRNSEGRSFEFNKKDKLELIHMVMTKQISPIDALYNSAKEYVKEFKLTEIIPE